MPISPEENTGDTVEVDIKASGKALGDRVQILSISVTKTINDIAEATFSLMDGDAISQNFKVTDSGQLDPGTKIEIRAGYGLRRPEVIFKGVVTAIGLRIDAKSGTVLDVTCQHEAFALRMGRKTAVSTDSKDSDVIANLLKERGLSADVADTRIVNSKLVQFGATDWDFIIARAEANGLLVTTENDMITIAGPNFAGAPALRITNGQDLMSFDAQISASTQFGGFATQSWDIRTQETVRADQPPKGQNKWGQLSAKDLAKVGNAANRLARTSTPLDPAELTELSDARQMRADLAHIIGTVTFQGNALPTLNTTLELAGLGKRFSGAGLICAIAHKISDGQWITRVILGSDAAWATGAAPVEPPAATGRLTPTRGLMIATVKKLDEDPKGLGRIQIVIPQIDDDASGIWARLGLGYATQNAGLMFAPEVGDEVIVGFLNDDPNYPIILGHLHNGQNKAPFEVDEENYTKAIITRTGMKLTFDEDRKIVSLETPDGNKVVLDDDAKTVSLTDQNGNSVELSDAGITLDSSADIKLSANGNIEFEADQDVKIEGINIDAKAQAMLDASGNASATLETSGSLTIKGAMVNIN